MNKDAMEALHSRDYSYANNLLQKSLEILKQSKPSESIFKLQSVTLNNLGCLYKRLENYPKALFFLGCALEVGKSISSDISNKAGTHLNICAIKSIIKQHDQALSHALTAIKILEKGKLQLSSSYVVALHAAGIEYQWLNLPLKAMKFFDKGYEIAVQKLGRKHPISLSLENAIQDYHGYRARNEFKVDDFIDKQTENSLADSTSSLITPPWANPQNPALDTPINKKSTKELLSNKNSSSDTKKAHSLPDSESKNLRFSADSIRSKAINTNQVQRSLLNELPIINPTHYKKKASEDFDEFNKVHHFETSLERKFNVFDSSPGKDDFYIHNNQNILKKNDKSQNSEYKNIENESDDFIQRKELGFDIESRLSFKEDNELVPNPFNSLEDPHKSLNFVQTAQKKSQDLSISKLDHISCERLNPSITTSPALVKNNGKDSRKQRFQLDSSSMNINTRKKPTKPIHEDPKSPKSQRSNFTGHDKACDSEFSFINSDKSSIKSSSPEKKDKMIILANQKIDKIEDSMKQLDQKFQKFSDAFQLVLNTTQVPKATKTTIKLERNAAALKIQKHTKGWISKKRYMKIKNSCKTIQRWWRKLKRECYMKLAYKNKKDFSQQILFQETELKPRTLDLCLQIDIKKPIKNSVVVTFSNSIKPVKRYKTFSRSIICIQALARGFLARRKVKKMIKLIIKIQSTIRMYRIKRIYNCILQAIIFIQQHYRSYRRKKYLKLLIKMSKDDNYKFNI